MSAQLPEIGFYNEEPRTFGGLSPDRAFWRYYFAGQVFPVLVGMSQGGLRATLQIIGAEPEPALPDRVAALLADALLAKLEGEEERGEETSPSAISEGVSRIAAERRRQVEAEGWTHEHDDDEHPNGELAEAAACYLGAEGPSGAVHPSWPWDDASWKPKDRVSNLVRAGALIAAEIDRLIREDTAP